MSIPTKNPCFLSYSPRSSGDVQTGEIQEVRGGGRCAAVWSGSILTNAALTAAPGACQSGGNILLFSGAGRLNSYFQHQSVLALSGVPVFFYDAGALALSGTSVSGQKIIGVLNQPQGQSGQFTAAGAIVNCDMPFNSGLCVSAASGTPGFTVSWTPEVNSNWPNT